ncbi:MAG: hypothetical protein L0191_05715 [Acidobacteria bacterium]|nr:hypothetical protein [Acidobacteriota bacterium]
MSKSESKRGLAGRGSTKGQRQLDPREIERELAVFEDEIVRLVEHLKVLRKMLRGMDG